jgi:hypothetical protein
MSEQKPNFIYVGAPKSGSTWLFQAMQEHPEIFVLGAKSSGYFESETPGSLAGYLQKFAKAGGSAAIGEISHDLYAMPDAAARIAAALPEVKVLLCLREPADFAASVLKWWTTHSDTYGVGIAEMEANPHFGRLTDYLGALQRLYARFAAAQIHVCFFEELRADPAAFLQGIYGFLGVSTGHRPTILNTVVNKARPARQRHLTKAVYAGGGLGRRLGLGAVVEWAKTTRAMNVLLYGS